MIQSNAIKKFQKASAEKSVPTLKDLYPHFTDEQIEEAEENLERYLDVVLRICNRLYNDSALTAHHIDTMMKS